MLLKIMGRLLLLCFCFSTIGCVNPFSRLVSDMDHPLFGTYKGTNCEVRIKTEYLPNLVYVRLFSMPRNEPIEKLVFGPTPPTVSRVRGTDERPEVLRIGAAIELDIAWSGEPATPEISEIRFLSSGESCQISSFERPTKSGPELEVSTPKSKFPKADDFEPEIQNEVGTRVIK